MPLISESYSSVVTIYARREGRKHRVDLMPTVHPKKHDDDDDDNGNHTNNKL